MIPVARRALHGFSQHDEAEHLENGDLIAREERICSVDDLRTKARELLDQLEDSASHVRPRGFELNSAARATSRLIANDNG